MTAPPEVARTVGWARSGTALLLGAVDALPDDAFARSSRLPRWSRAHVVAHVARNAEALLRLLTWARTGVETPMYASPEQRGREIEDGARLAPADLRGQLHDTAAALDAGFAELPAQAWSAQVRTARGRLVPAAQVPWLRVREVWLHPLDLGTPEGDAAADLPPDLADALLDGVLGDLAAREGVPPLELAVTDRGGAVRRLGADGVPGVRVSGTAAALALWLTGRGPAPAVDEGGPAPVLPAWL